LSGEPQQALIDPLSAAAVEAGVEICVGSKVIGADRSGAIVLEGGKRLEADLIVGADGIHSVVRRSVAGEPALGQHRKGAIRLMISAVVASGFCRVRPMCLIEGSGRQRRALFCMRIWILHGTLCPRPHKCCRDLRGEDRLYGSPAERFSSW
jgi:2-polyprenyl-6-methoxyphenol hydroxylase-like FAD-dependent oxidoreductase